MLFVLEPAVARLDPATRGAFGRALALRSSFAVYFPAMAGLTVLAGIVLYFVIDGRALYPMGMPRGQVFAAGAALGIVGFVYGGAAEGRATKKLKAMARAIEGHKGPPTADETARFEALMATMRTHTKVSVAILALGTFCMATFQYVG
jgi:hypothetical protein